MQTYVIRRLLILVPVLLGISIVVFVIMRLLPGDVAAMILSGPEGGVADPQALETLRLNLGLDQPLHIQYVTWVGGLLRLDAGLSLWSQRPVFQEIGERLPLTLELAILALSISLVIALPIGILSALKQDTWVDYVFRVVSIGGLALPSFWIGTLTILALSLWFSYSPPLGYVRPTQDLWKNLQQLIWPALVIGYNNAAIVSRMTRSTMLEVLRDDYVRTARAKGLDMRTVLVRHAFRNAVLPVLTIAAIQLGHLLGGAVLMETIFTLPGVGRFLIDAIFRRDYPVVQTIIMLMGLLFVSLNLVVDLLYGVLDPRIRYS
ncbi:Glutathione transport system permease protein GsiC [Anaerolineae bacterium]|nr:Glutathione transport system permease protein GsiC [Anaerolineae bacterium]